MHALSQPYDTERALRALSRLHGGRCFSGRAEALSFLETWKDSSLEELKAQAGTDEAEEAQELAFQALEAERPAEALPLAHRALQLDPDCVDALVVQVRCEATRPAEAASRLKALLRRAEALVDEGLLRSRQGLLWGVLEARPLMRLRLALAEALEAAGRPKAALSVLEELLQMDEEDPLEARRRLVLLYLRLGRGASLRALLDAFPGNRDAFLHWAEALALLRAFLDAATERNEHAARLALERARAANPFFEAFLTGQQKPPRREPTSPEPGSPEEGAQLLQQLGPAWTADRPALYWLFRNA